MLYARFLPEHLERALEIMGDMVLRPTLVDLEREREVIVEEIRMYEDRPDQLADEHLSGLIFHGDPLGRPIIGSAETVRGVDHDTLRGFHGSTYTAANVFVVAAGKLDSEELERMVEEKLGGLPDGRAVRQGREAERPREPLLLQVQGDGAVPRLDRLAGHPGAQRGPLRDGGAQQRARRRDEQPALPGGAREARPRLRRLLLPPGLLGRRRHKDLRRLHDRQRRGGREDHRRATPTRAGGARRRARSSSAPSSSSRARPCSPWRARRPG